MIRERPIFRRRLRIFWRQTLEATLGLKYAGLYGIPRLLLQHLGRNKPIHLVDIGAYDGAFTFGLACYCGLLSGVMVEPLPHKAAALKERFRGPDYRVFECALADQPGKTELHVNQMEATASLLQLRREMQEWDGLPLGKDRVIPCAQRTLDSVIAEAGVPVIDLLKLDVQGVEHLVLAGGEEALKKSKRIWTECSFKPLYAGSSTFGDIYGLLAARGFRLLELSENFRSTTGELLQVDALFARD
jgi:FkbM family methyltransferase